MPIAPRDVSTGRSVDSLLSLLPHQGLLKPVGAAIGRVLSIDRLVDTYEQANLEHPSFPDFFERFLGLLGVSIRVSEQDLENIPADGPVVVVANHPFGFVEGCILGTILPRRRPDARLLANFMLETYFPEVSSQWVFSVNPFGTEDAKKQNLTGIRSALQHVKKGGLLAVFPAGEVAHVDLRRRAITDPPWSPTISRFIRNGKAPVVPIYFDGNNSAIFQLLGLLHPRLRTMMLPNELFRQQHREVEMRIGTAIPFSRLEEFTEDDEMMRFLRRRTYLLRHRGRSVEWPKFAFPSLPFKHQQEPIVDAVDPNAIASEIAALPADRCLAEVGDHAVYYGYQNEIPNTLREIGRLREITFRATGEGTGRSLDLDAFDAYYIQLFIWDRKQREIVGAYRLGPTDTIVGRHGKKGLYTSTLFHYGPQFLERINPALELGRSFVRTEHQRSYSPLLLLWKGIGAYIVANPRYRVLFGPVSISNDYCPISRQLMVNYFGQLIRSEQLTHFVKARSPFRQPPMLLQPEDDTPDVRVWDIEDLSAAIADIETDQKGLPVLLRQYLKLGGRLLAFNVDHQFAKCLDGLIMCDLKTTDPRMLMRYMGKEGAARFQQFHELAAVPASD